MLENRNISKEEVNNLLNPNSSFEDMPYGIFNMVLGTELFLKNIEQKKKIGILVDCDTDGYTSSTLMFLFLVNECGYERDKIQFFMHKGKEHGLSDKVAFSEILKSDVEFLIVPDAGSNDIDEIKALVKKDISVLVLDHHVVNENNSGIYRLDGVLKGVVVNNQVKDVSKYVSGVGVVYKFITALTQSPLNHYLDLVAVGSVADSMRLNEHEVRYYTKMGLDNINNELFKAYLNKIDFYENVTPTLISFNVANYINAVIRVGTMEQKIDLLRAMIGEEEERHYTPRKSAKNPNPTERIETLQEYVVRMSNSVKQSQDRKKKASIKKCIEYINENNLQDDKIIIILDKNGKMVDKALTGLVVMGITSTYKKPCIILRNNKEQYSGSMRGIGVESFKDILEKTEACEVIGHNNAAGVNVDKSEYNRFLNRIKKISESLDIENKGIEVDCVLDAKELRESDLEGVLSLESIWHQHCQSPKFLVKDIEINSKAITQPYPLITIFKSNNINFKKNYCRSGFYDEFTLKKEKSFGSRDLLIDLIVEVKKDKYGIYLDIVDYDSRLIDKKAKSKRMGRDFDF